MIHASFTGIGIVLNITVCSHAIIYMVQCVCLQENPNRYLGWAGWSDADSGLDTFSYKVHALVPNNAGLLTESDPTVAEGKQSAFEYVTQNCSHAGHIKAIKM